MPRPDPRDYINKRLDCGDIASFPPRLLSLFTPDTAYLATFVPCQHALWDVRIYPQNFQFIRCTGSFAIERAARAYDALPGDEQIIQDGPFRFVYKRVAR